MSARRVLELAAQGDPEWDRLLGPPLETAGSSRQGGNPRRPDRSLTSPASLGIIAARCAIEGRIIDEEPSERVGPRGRRQLDVAGVLRAEHADRPRDGLRLCPRARRALRRLWLHRHLLPRRHLVDGISGNSTFSGGGFCWVAQSGATSYQVVRSSKPDFTADCTSSTVTGTCFRGSDRAPDRSGILLPRPTAGPARRELGTGFERAGAVGRLPSAVACPASPVPEPPTTPRPAARPLPGTDAGQPNRTCAPPAPGAASTRRRDPAIFPVRPGGPAEGHVRGRVRPGAARPARGERT
jgi:hypothetical protein